MADKMIRNAGRYVDELGKGFSKAINVDRYGNTLNKDNLVRKLFDAVDINAGEAIETTILSRDDFAYGHVEIILANNRKIKVIISYYILRLEDNQYIKTSDEVIYDAENRKSFHSIFYNLKTDFYSLKIENIDTVGTHIREGSYEEVSDNINLGREIKRSKNKLLSVDMLELNANEEYETKIFSADDFNFTNVNILLTNNRKIDVYIKYYYYRDTTSEYISNDYILSYKSETRQFQHNFHAPLKSDFYSFKIVNSDIVGLNVLGQSVEKRFKNDMFVDSDKISNIINELSNNLNLLKHGVNESLKSPQSDLIFVESPIKAKVLAKGFDGLFYLIDDSNIIKKTESMIEDNLTESGITWSVSQLGDPVNIIAFPKSVVVFANKDNQALIYQMDSINDTPTEVYRSNTAGVSRWSKYNAFGIKGYYNGIVGYVMAGVYGNGDDKRDLLLSKDGGKTFNVIKQTVNEATGINSHWHDVAFDVYGGLLWASQGDQEINRGLYYSDNFGDSWKQLEPSTELQPTAIIPFGDRVIFGRDNGRPGLSIYNRPKTTDEFNNFEVEHLLTFKPNVFAYAYYGESAIQDGNEAYMNFLVYEGDKPKLIIGTGDGGKSWHHLFMVHDIDKFHGFCAIDKDNIYGYGEGNKILIANRPKWS